MANLLTGHMTELKTRLQCNGGSDDSVPVKFRILSSNQLKASISEVDMLFQLCTVVVLLHSVSAQTG